MHVCVYLVYIIHVKHALHGMHSIIVVSGYKVYCRGCTAARIVLFGCVADLASFTADDTAAVPYGTVR